MESGDIGIDFRQVGRHDTQHAIACLRRRVDTGGTVQ